MIAASKIIDRALHIADIANTDFLTHQELTDYLNDCYKALYQNIIEHNLDIFTVEAHLVGSNGVYKIPWDCYQIKAIKNPVTGNQLIRKTDSMGKYSGGYTIKNDTIVIDGINPGPVVIVYWRKPYFISIPNKTLEINVESGAIIDTSLNNILYRDNGYLSLWTPKGSQTTEIEYNSNYVYKLVKDEYVFVMGGVEDEEGEILEFTVLIDLASGDEIWSSEKKVDYFIKSDDGLVYLGYVDEDILRVYKLDKLIWEEEHVENSNYIVINNELYTAPENAFPIGLFDDRPAYVAGDVLYLINPNFSLIEEKLDLPIMKVDNQLKYGIISNGKIYSNIPDTALDFPNNILYELLAYRLAQCFLAKQNAASEGVQAMYDTMKAQFFSSIDMAAGYPRMNNVR